MAFEKISFFQAIISAIGASGMLKISIALFLLRLSQNKWYARSLRALIRKSAYGARSTSILTGVLTPKHGFCHRLLHVSLVIVIFNTYKH